MTPRRSRGFTATDLIIGLVVCLLALALMLPAIHRGRGTNTFVGCTSNLRQIGQALLLYANENNGNYPRTRFSVRAAAPTQYTNVQAPNPFKSNGPQFNDVTAAMFLLLRTQDLTGSVFICPADSAGPWDANGGNVQMFSNFAGGQFLSYSLQNGYPNQVAINDGFRWTNTLPADFAVAADMNPGSNDVLTVRPTSPFSQLQKANSPNHGFQGQNVLYGDGHVELQHTPFCGVKQDNIYGAGLKVNGVIDPNAYLIVASPNHKDDSVLLPTAAGKPPPAAVPVVTEGIRWYTYLSLLAFAGVIASFSLALRQRPAQEE